MPANPGAELSSLAFGSMIGGPLVAVVEAQTQAARATVDFIKSVGFDEDNNPVYVEFKYPKELAPYQPAVAAHIRKVKVTSPGAGYDPDNPPEVSFGTGVSDAQAKAVIVAGKVVRVELIDAGEYAAEPTVAIADPPPGTGALAAALELDWAEDRPATPAVFQDMRISVPILSVVDVPSLRVEEATVDFHVKINAMETRSDSQDLAISGNAEVRQRWPGGAGKLSVSCAYQRKTSSGESVERTYSMQIHVRVAQGEPPPGMEKLLGILETAIQSTPI